MEGGHPHSEVAGVATERLVAADSRQRHLHVARRGLGHDVCRDRRGVGERLVERPHDRRQQRLQVGLQDLLVMVGLEAPGDEPRVRQLVVRRRRAAEAHREGGDPSRRHLAHAGDHRARVDAAGEEDAERHVALEPPPHRLAHLLSNRGQLLRQRRPSHRRRGAERKLPVATQRESTVGERRRVRRRKLPDLAEDRVRGRRVAEREVVVEGRPVERARDGRMTEERLRLRGEQEQSSPVPVVERLLAQPITREEQPPLGAVPDREREHAAQPLHARLAIRGVRL